MMTDCYVYKHKTRQQSEKKTLCYLESLFWILLQGFPKSARNYKKYKSIFSIDIILLNTVKIGYRELLRGELQDHKILR